jgi:hypothetical protein
VQKKWMRVADLNRIGRYYEYRESPAILTRQSYCEEQTTTGF